MSTATAIVLILAHTAVALALIFRCCNTKDSRPQAVDRETRER